jgi:hypothetical protein
VHQSHRPRRRRLDLPDFFLEIRVLLTRLLGLFFPGLDKPCLRLPLGFRLLLCGVLPKRFFGFVLGLGFGVFLGVEVELFQLRSRRIRLLGGCLTLPEFIQLLLEYFRASLIFGRFPACFVELPFKASSLTLRRLLGRFRFFLRGGRGCLFRGLLSGVCALGGCCWLRLRFRREDETIRRRGRFGCCRCCFGCCDCF